MRTVALLSDPAIELAATGNLLSSAGNVLV